MTSRLPGDPPNTVRITCTIDGLEDRALWDELSEFLKHQAEVNRLVSRIVVPTHGPGIAIELRMPVPQIVEFDWRDYRVRATGFEGQLIISCRKQPTA